MAVRLLVRHPRSAPQGSDEIRFEFEQVRVVIGRGPGAEVRLPGTSVSELHATIELVGGNYTLRDDGSTNGTTINERKLVPGRPSALADGDEIGIAEFTLHFSHGPLERPVTLPERTASLARRMLGELLGGERGAREPPYLQVSEGPDQGTLINFGPTPSRLLVGRGEECDLVLRDVDVSRAHIEFIRDLDGVQVRDAESKNGLEVNGRRMRERRLKHGDLLRVGATTLLYQDPAERALRELERLPDQPWQRTRTRTRSEPALVAPLPVSEPVIGEAPKEAERAGTVDLVIYALAVLVLVASVVGMIWLFQ